MGTKIGRSLVIRKPRRWRVFLIVAMLTLLAAWEVGSTSAVRTARATTCATNAIACDSFSRTTANSWGTADVGGAWTSSGAAYSVTPGAGTILSNSTTPSNFLTVSGQDVDLVVEISPPPLSGSYVTDDGVGLRYSSTAGSWYQLSAYAATGINNGNLTVELKHKPDNGSVRPDFPTTVPAGSPYFMRFQAQGVNPTTLRWKLWAAASTEPASWADSGTDSLPALQAAGGVGVVAYVDNGQQPVTFNSFNATSIVTPPPTLITCASSAVACDSFNRTLSNSWGTADVGGSWNTSGAAYSVSPGAGSIVSDPNTPSNFLTVASQDLDVVTEITPPPLSSSYVADDGVAVRYVAGAGAWYQLSAYGSTRDNSGNLIVELKQKPSNSPIRPDFNSTVPAGKPFWLRLEAQGTNPTTLRWRVWADGATEPATWADTGSDSTSVLQGPGGVGLVSYVTSGKATAVFNSLNATALPSTPPNLINCPTTAIACDSFNRNVSNGWGAADVGGTWTNGGAAYAVSPGRGTIISDSTTPSNFLNVSTTNVDVLALIGPPPVTSTYTADDGAAVRYQASSGSWYQLNAYAANGINGGNLVVQLKRKPDNAFVRPEYLTTVPGGNPYRVRLEAIGTNPTTLRWKLWLDGSAEPANWTDAGSDGTPALQTAGGIGVVSYVNTGQEPVTFAGVIATAVSSPPQLITCSATDVACDSFNRTVTNSWGNADIGGAWSTAGPSYGVSPGRATILSDSTTPSNFLNVSTRDVDVLARITPPPISSSYTPDDGVAVRYQAASGSWYQVNAYAASGINNGNLVVQLKRKPDNFAIRPDLNTSVAGGSPFWVRFEAQGSTPTTLRWKVWLDGNSEPAGWADSGTDGTAGLQGPGGLGVVAYVNTGQQTAIFNSFEATGVATVTPCAAGVVVCDSYNRTTSNGWGAADTGGSWSVMDTAANWNVTPGNGSVTVGPANQERAYLGTVSVQDIEVLQKVVLPTSKQANNCYAYVLGRMHAGPTPTYYRVGVFQGGSNSNIQIRAQREDGTNLDSDINTGIRAADGAVVWLRVQFQGINPTSVRARAWADGATEPTYWALDTTDSTASEQVPGFVGVRDRNEDTANAHTFRHQNYQAVSLPARAGIPTGSVAADGFQRTLNGTWGNADVGGPWSVSNNAFAVVPGRGTVVADSSAPRNFLTAVSIQDVDARALVTMPHLANTGDTGIAVRYRSATGAWYQLSAYYPSSLNGSKYVVQLKRKPQNVQIRPDFSTTIPGGTALWFRLQAQGVNPTVLRWKVWQDGTAEPSTWTDTGTDSTAALQTAGGVGLQCYMSVGTVTTTFNQMYATGIP